MLELTEQKRSEYIPVVSVIRSDDRNVLEGLAARRLLLHSTQSAGWGGRGERESQTSSWWQQAAGSAQLFADLKCISDPLERLAHPGAVGTYCRGGVSQLCNLI